MPLTPAKAKANKKYHEKFDNVQFRVPTGKREEIASYAASRGESMNAFIIRAIIETMERDNDSDLSE